MIVSAVSCSFSASAIGFAIAAARAEIQVDSGGPAFAVNMEFFFPATIGLIVGFIALGILFLSVWGSGLGIKKSFGLYHWVSVVLLLPAAWFGLILACRLGTSLFN